MRVADDVRANSTYKTTLEIGAGTLNQLQYEPKIGPYDIVEPFKELFEKSKELNRIRYVFTDINEISGNQKYDRITSIATLEHICNLPEVVARSGLLLNRFGLLRVSIPNEGSFLWKLSWYFTTGLEFKIKYGLDYGLLMKHEHVNTANEINDLLSFFFDSVKIQVMGFGRSLSFYHYLECSNPDINKCHQYLSRYTEHYNKT